MKKRNSKKIIPNEKLVEIIKKNNTSFIIGVFSVIIVALLFFKLFPYIKGNISNNENQKNSVVEKGDITSTSPNAQIYTIKEGDFLWQIAEEKYGDGNMWTKIVKDNYLTEPDTIHPGNTLQLIY